MKADPKAFSRATLLMLGTIIGAGTFALPAAMSQTGVAAGTVAFWIAALAILVIHLLYADIILANTSAASHRLPAQAGASLGPWGRRIAYLSHPAQIIGACLAYLILGGEFLNQLATQAGFGDGALWWQLAFWAGGAATVFVGLKFVARVEAALTWTLGVLLVIATALYVPHLQHTAIVTAHWTPALDNAGVFLFAIFGWAVIPEVASVMGRRQRETRLAVALGTLGAALLIWFFGAFAAAALGANAGPEQLGSLFPPMLAWLLPALGFLAVATSFITLIQDLKAMLHLDAHLSKPVAWAIALGSPLFLLFVTARNFLDTVSFVGGVVTGFNAILIAIMAHRVLRKRRLSNIWWRSIAPALSVLAFGAILIRRVLESVR